MSAERPENTHDATVQPPPDPFGGFLWDAEGPIITVAADRSLGSTLRRIAEKDARWVVVVRTLPDSAEVYYYAFFLGELGYLANFYEFPDRKKWTIERAVNMHELTSSMTSRGRRPAGPVLSRVVDFDTAGLIAGRVVDFDAAGRIVAIGLHRDMGGSCGGPTDSPEYLFDLGPTRGVRGPQPAADATEIDVTLSAQTKAEIKVDATELVDFQIELSSEAVPLSVLKTARAKVDVPITVSLTVENDAIEIVRDPERTVDPPAPKQPRTGFFLVKGIRIGVSRLAVVFRQGGTDLGIIGLAVQVVEAAPRAERAQGNATAASRDFADDDKLALIVEQRIESGEVFYQYILHSEALGLPYRKLRSKALLDRGGGPAATMLAFVERIYDRVTRELPSWGDSLRQELKDLQRESRALGASLCKELLDPEVAKVLWPLRDRISSIQIVSWEPYIPWELVRLRDPDSDEIDDRFLAEYGLVRTLSDEMPLRELPMTQWGYLGATFPMGTLPPVGAELEYFTGTTAESLRGHGIQPRAIRATRNDFYDALADLDFDVLHISCHAESPHQSIERASLIISDETLPGDNKPRFVEVDTITVEAEARLKRHRPLVFLNACETGRVGAVLTAWGGWPNVFLRAGAGAFVGAAWAVRDKPAAAFSTAFYNALLDGKTLAEAAGIARAAAKKLGDASWLAFKVYGHPRAVRRSPRSVR
jgi:CHAT domain